MTASHPTSSALAQAIDEFLDDMKDRDRKSPFYKEVLCSRSILALKDSPKEAKECANDLTSFLKDLDGKKATSKSSKSLSVLTPFLNGLVTLMDACSIMVQASPFAVGVIFCGARFVLNILQHINPLFERVTETMGKIGSYLNCYAKFSVAYETSDEVRECLVDSYKGIVEFWATAAKLLSEHTLMNTIKNTFSSLTNAINNLATRLEKDCDRVVKIAAAEEALRVHSSRKISEVEREGKLKDGIFDWIKGESTDDLDMRGDLQIYSRMKHGATCDWLFETDEFKRWRDDFSTDIFWYHDGPGSGKTIMSSAVIKHLADRGLSTAYYFYSFSDFSRRRSITATRSLSLQLLNMQKAGIPDKLKDLYISEMKVAKHLRQMPIASEVMSELLNGCSLVYIIVDGLDECQDDENAQSIFSDLVSHASYGITKWFFTSREDHNIRKMMERANAVILSPDPAVLFIDVRMFLTDKLQATGYSQEQIDNFVNRSERSFLYASFLVEMLQGEGITCANDVRRALIEFPTTLTGCYIRTLLKLSERHPREQELVRRIFTILVTAVQSITWDELCIALAIRSGSRSHSNKEQPDKKLIRSLCGSFLVKDETNKNGSPLQIKLYHKSIQDFLLTDPEDLITDKSIKDMVEDNLPRIRKFFVDPIQGSLSVGRDCLTFLQYESYTSPADVSSLLSEDNDNEHKFLKYCAAFWVLHFKDQSEHSQSDFDQIRRFMESPNFWTCADIQSRVVPYLFNSYRFLVPEAQVKLRDGATSRRKEVHLCEPVRREPLPMDTTGSFGVPLPAWLGQYPPHGVDLDYDFCTFVTDWNKVLCWRPGSLDQCPPLRQMKSNLGSNFPQSERIKVWRLCDKSRANRISDIRLNSIFLLKGKLYADVVYRKVGDKMGLLRYRRIAIFSKGSTIQSTFETTTELASLARKDTLFHIQETSSVEILEFNTSLCHLKLIWNDSCKVFKAPTLWSELELNEAWQVQHIDKFSPAWGNVTIFHISKIETEVKGDSEMKDNKLNRDAESEPESESESDFDSDSEAESESTENTSHGPVPDESHPKHSSDQEIREHWMVVLCDSYQPLWIPLASVQVVPYKRIPISAHPSLPIVVASSACHEAIIVQLKESRWNTVYYSKTCVHSDTHLYRELEFSPCGRFLYSLDAYIMVQERQFDCSVGLSIWHFAENQQEKLERAVQQSQEITYQFERSVEGLSFEPLLLVSWSQDEVVVALPRLECEPKIVKFNLHAVDEKEKHVQTLAESVYFPSSIISSSPVLLYQHRTSKDHELFLSLMCQAPRRPNTRNEDGGHVLSTEPVVLRWKIANKDGWRMWDQNTDGKSSDLTMRGGCPRDLSGSFLKEEINTNIPVRSGLDWTRKGFMTGCPCIMGMFGRHR